MLFNDSVRCAPAVWTVLLMTLVPAPTVAQTALPALTGDTIRLAPAPAPARSPKPAAPPASTAVATPAAVSQREVGTFRLGATIGIDFASDFTGYAIRPQVAYTLTEVSRGLYLELAGHFGITLGGATGYSGQYLEIVPALRLRYAASSAISFYGDAGFGFFSLHTSLDNNMGSNTITGAVLRLPLGLRLALSPSVDLVLEPGGFNFYFNTNANKFHYSLLGGLLLRV